MSRIQVYEAYIPKSNVFLFPLLDLPRAGRGVFAPVQTYLSVPGLIDPHDMRLVVSYNNEQPLDQEWLDYQLQKLMGHPLFEVSTPTADNTRILFVFNLSQWCGDILKFLAGRYSQLSPEFKKKLSAHYGVRTPNWAAVEALLYPDKGFPAYAQHFGVDEAEFRKATNGELCPVYDPELETCPFDVNPRFADELRTA